MLKEPLTQKIWSEFSSRMGFGDPEKITLEQISRVSQEIFDKQVTLVQNRILTAEARRAQRR